MASPTPYGGANAQVTTPGIFGSSHNNVTVLTCGDMLLRQATNGVTTLAIFKGPVPSLLRLQTRRLTAFVRWQVECDLCNLILMALLKAGWLCSAINLASDHSAVQLMTISVLAL